MKRVVLPNGTSRATSHSAVRVTPSRPGSAPTMLGTTNEIMSTGGTCNCERTLIKPAPARAFSHRSGLIVARLAQPWFYPRRAQRMQNGFNRTLRDIQCRNTLCFAGSIDSTVRSQQLAGHLSLTKKNSLVKPMSRLVTRTSYVHPLRNRMRIIKLHRNVILKSCV